MQRFTPQRFPETRLCCADVAASDCRPQRLFQAGDNSCAIISRTSGMTFVP